MNIKLKLNLAQHDLMHQWPFMADLSQHLTFVPNESVPTLGVNKAGVVYYNPDYLDKVPSKEEMVKLLKHEVLHLYLDYFGRQQERESLRWNAAHDLEISHLVQPINCLKPEQFGLAEGRSGEYYYDHLHTRGAEGHGCGQANIEPGESTPASQVATIRAATKISNTPGIDPSLLKRALEITQPGRANSTLRAIQGTMVIAGLHDSSYSRPNRRTQGRHGPILPASIHREPKVACILDVSGSMVGHLERATSAVLGAVSSVGAALDVVAWDTQPLAFANVRTKHDLAKLRASGGGTDMAKAILAAPERGKFDAILVVTDCDTPWPSRDQLRRLPPVYVLCVTDNRPPSYIQAIKV